MKKVVLIEDDANLFSLVQYNLEKDGFAFAGSQTGNGAVDLCRSEKPDLVILDIMLPDYPDALRVRRKPARETLGLSKTGAFRGSSG